jgi:hypothetical protein
LDGVPIGSENQTTREQKQTEFHGFTVQRADQGSLFEPGTQLSHGHRSHRARRGTLSVSKHVLEGEGKTMRHIKFRSEADLERPFVRRFIRAAIEQIAHAPVKEPNQ